MEIAARQNDCGFQDPSRHNGRLVSQSRGRGRAMECLKTQRMEPAQFDSPGMGYF